MPSMWKRKLLSSTVAVLLAAVTAVLGVEGYAIFLAIALIVPVAMFAGFGAEIWLDARRHRSLN
jgi:hypothetical protein